MIVRFDTPIWTVLLGLFIFSFIVAYVSAVIDSYIIKVKYGKIKTLNHYTRNIIRGVIFTSSTLLVCWSIPSFILLLLYQSFIFSFYFDIILNVKRGLDMWYIGKTADLDILARIFLGGNKGKKYAIIKIVLAIFSSIGVSLIYPIQ